MLWRPFFWLLLWRAAASFYCFPLGQAINCQCSFFPRSTISSLLFWSCCNLRAHARILPAHLAWQLPQLWWFLVTFITYSVYSYPYFFSSSEFTRTINITHVKCWIGSFGGKNQTGLARPTRRGHWLDYSSRIGTDCTAKRNIGKLLANSIIYRYLCSEELLEDVLGGKDALRAFKESDEKGYLEVEVLSFFLLFFP